MNDDRPPSGGYDVFPANSRNYHPRAPWEWRMFATVDVAAKNGLIETAELRELLRGVCKCRFPEDFAFQLTSHEISNLKSQNVISSWGGRRTAPWVFTEHGVAMLSSVLRSETAAKINIQVMRAFVRLRRLMAAPGDLAIELRKLAETVDLPDD